MSINYANAGKLIKEARKNKGLTQKQLAEKTGLATVTIQQYERNLREPRLKNIIKIANALNVSPESLFGSTRIGFTTEFDREKLNYYNPGIFSEGNIRYMSELLDQLNFAASGLMAAIQAAINKKNYIDHETDVLAAHTRTDVEQTPEGIQHDLDIMNDDKNWK